MPLSRFIGNTIATLLIVWVGFSEYNQHGVNWRPVMESWCLCFASYVMFVGAEEFADYTEGYGLGLQLAIRARPGRCAGSEPPCSYGSPLNCS